MGAPYFPRDRLRTSIAAGAVIVLGLASRRYAALLPHFVALYAGDTLWAMMVYLALGVFFPLWSCRRIAATALAISYAIEVSQLHHAPWIDAIRHTRIGGLILGFGFLWSDLVCYTAGVAIATAIEVGFRERSSSRS